MDGAERKDDPSGTDLPSNLAHRSLVDSGIAKPVDDEQSQSSKPANPKHAESPQHTKEGTTQSNKEGQANKTSPKNSESKANASGPGRSAGAALPEFIVQRNKLFDDLKKKQDAEISSRSHPEINVVIDLGRGNERAVIAKAWESTPVSFLKDLKGDIGSDIVVAKVNGKELWDLDRPLEESCRLSYVPFGSPQGRHVFWHSSAHVLGEAAECHYPECLLSHGPPVEQGFFYDMALSEGYYFYFLV